MEQEFEAVKKKMLENIIKDFENTLYSMDKAGMEGSCEASDWGGDMTLLTGTELSKYDIPEFIEYLKEEIK